jgi:hypothetical protein
MCIAAVLREINAKIFETGPDTEYPEFQPTQAIEAIRRWLCYACGSRLWLRPVPRLERKDCVADLSLETLR